MKRIQLGIVATQKHGKLTGHIDYLNNPAFSGPAGLRALAEIQGPLAESANPLMHVVLEIPAAEDEEGSELTSFIAQALGRTGRTNPPRASVRTEREPDASIEARQARFNSWASGIVAAGTGASPGEAVRLLSRALNAAFLEGRNSATGQ